jgi:gamma-D-glutamyl-L-lysine dipeptidyl-peptidase
MVADSCSMPAMSQKRSSKNYALALLVTGSLMAWTFGCSSPQRPAEMKMKSDDVSAPALRALQSVKDKYAPDSHLTIFDINVLREGNDFVLQGEVDNPAVKQEAVAAVAKTGLRVIDRITVLPALDLNNRVCGICTLSVINVREKPGHGSEMGTQILMGNSFKVWKQQTNWFLVQTDDGYLGWAEGGGFVNCTPEEASAWNDSPRLIVTALEERILEQPDARALPISDVVLGCLVRQVGETGEWFQVELPDGRGGYLPKTSAMNFSQWQKSRHATPENIERTARSFLGRPYFWGCNTSRGMDCSGLTKLVFFLNGIALNRNAAQQLHQGAAVALDADLKKLKRGDLLFFGHRATGSKPEMITHVGIYLENKLFIHSSEMVRLNSLDPASPLRDENRIKSLIHARRILSDS